MATSIQERTSIGDQVAGGVIGGLAGGLVFGAMMGGMGMLPMVAGLVGSSSALVGFGVHMVISAIIGAGFGVLAGSVASGRSQGYVEGGLLGLVYGAIWWVLGPLTLMPLMMGMGVQFASAFTTPRLMSLVGHLVFGLITGLVYVWYRQR